METKIPIILCIDVEPDGFFIKRDEPLPWLGYEAIYKFFCDFRLCISKATQFPAHYSWYYRIDPQIEETYGSPDWPWAHYPKYIEDLARNGDEIGLHPHAYRWEAKINNWVEDLGNQSWVNHCVEMGFSNYKKQFNRNCDSFRFGAYWINNETLDLVERLGARFDLTPEPGLMMNKRPFHGEFYTASLPSYDKVPRLPYQPSKSDFTKPDRNRKEGFWIIPLSTGFIQHRYGRLESIYHRVFNPELVKPKCITLNIGSYGVENFSKIANHLLNTLEKPYLALVLRSDNGIKPRNMKNINDNLTFLLNHPLAKRFAFSSAAELMTLLGLIDDRGSNGHGS